MKTVKNTPKTEKNVSLAAAEGSIDLRKGKAPKAEKVETPAAAPAKEKKAETAAAPKAEKKVGVIGTILEILQKNKSKKGVTKERMLEILVERFPSREADAMQKTINCQIPTRMGREKGVEIVKTEAGGFILA